MSPHRPYLLSCSSVSPRDISLHITANSSSWIRAQWSVMTHNGSHIALSIRKMASFSISTDLSLPPLPTSAIDPPIPFLRDPPPPTSSKPPDLLHLKEVAGRYNSLPFFIRAFCTSHSRRASQHAYTSFSTRFTETSVQ